MNALLSGQLVRTSQLVPGCHVARRSWSSSRTLANSSPSSRLGICVNPLKLGSTCNPAPRREWGSKGQGLLAEHFGGPPRSGGVERKTQRGCTTARNDHISLSEVERIGI